MPENGVLKSQNADFQAGLIAYKDKSRGQFGSKQKGICEGHKCFGLHLTKGFTTP